MRPPSRSVLLLAAPALVVALLLVLFVPAVQSAQAQSETPVFEDIALSAWYYEYVASLAEEGVFEGTECEEGFCPGQPLLRREMAVWLIRALEDDGPSDYDSRFSDVEDDTWWTPYIERMADLEITVGCSSKELPKFCPDGAVTRAQMASFLTRALVLPEAEAADFEDVDSETNVHADNINRLFEAKITVGCSSDESLLYCPDRSVTRAQMTAFIYRALQWRQEHQDTAENSNDEQVVIEDNNPGVFLTPENDLSRLIKHELVDEYAADHPWLMETWNYTNRADFDYHTNDEGNYIKRSFSSSDERNGLYEVDVYKLGIYKNCMDDLYCWGVLVHEMAHIYTLANGIAARPGTLAIAHLYFDSIGDYSKCRGKELFADAAKFTLPTKGYIFTYYWDICDHIAAEPTPEAVAVVRSSFAGEMPQWLYETFQKDDGSLDYEAIWDAVQAIREEYLRFAVVYQLRDEFGGYCSDQAATESAFRTSSLAQPWRDGGCSN